MRPMARCGTTLQAQTAESTVGRGPDRGVGVEVRIGRSGAPPTGMRGPHQAHGHYDVGWSAIPVALYRSIPRLGSRETYALSIRRYRSLWCV